MLSIKTQDDNTESPVTADIATLEDMPNYSYCRFVIIKFFFKLFLGNIKHKIWT